MVDKGKVLTGGAMACDETIEQGDAGSFLMLQLNWEWFWVKHCGESSLKLLRGEKNVAGEFELIMKEDWGDKPMFSWIKDLLWKEKHSEPTQNRVETYWCFEHIVRSGIEINAFSHRRIGFVWKVHVLFFGEHVGTVAANRSRSWRLDKLLRINILFITSG